MKKFLVTITLLLCAGTAQAQQGCWPDPLNPRTWPEIRENSTHRVWGFVCVDDFSVRQRGWCGKLTDYEQKWYQLGTQYAKLPVAEREALVKKYTVAQPCGAEYSELLSDLWKSFAGVGPVWEVAPNSTNLTRPTYPLNNGIRGSVSNGRTSILVDGVSNKCNCQIRSVESRSVYCSVDKKADTVALCRKSP